MDDFFRNQQSPRGEPQMGAFTATATARNVPQPQLPRRFTTDSGRVPTMSSITAQRGPEPQDFASTTVRVYRRLEGGRRDDPDGTEMLTADVDFAQGSIGMSGL